MDFNLKPSRLRPCQDEWQRVIPVAAGNPADASVHDTPSPCWTHEEQCIRKDYAVRNIFTFEGLNTKDLTILPGLNSYQLQYQLTQLCAHRDTHTQPLKRKMSPFGIQLGNCILHSWVFPVLQKQWESSIWLKIELYCWALKICRILPQNEINFNVAKC